MSILDTDDFNRAGSVDLGTKWDECTGETNTGGFDIFTNGQVRPALNSADSSETNNNVTWPDGQYSKVTYFATNADGAGSGIGPTVRAATGATRTYYRLCGNASGYELGSKKAGTFASYKSGTGTTFTAGDTNTLEVTTDGSGNAVLVCKKNGVQFDTYTDSASPIASGRAGIGHSSTSTVGESISAWEGGDVAGGGGGGAGTALTGFGRRLQGFIYS